MSALTLFAEQKANEADFDGYHEHARLIRKLVAEIKRIEIGRDEAIVRLTNAALEAARVHR